MTSIRLFGRRHVRAWFIRELTGGQWVGERIHGGREIVAKTIVGPEWQVTAAVRDHRQGLPIIRMPLRPSGGGRTA